jgi:hypothetical protein
LRPPFSARWFRASLVSSLGIITNSRDFKDFRSIAFTSVKAEVLLLAVKSGGGWRMLYTLAVILLIAWLLGMVGTYTIGAFVHVLLVVALVLFVVGMLSGRSTVV